MIYSASRIQISQDDQEEQTLPEAAFYMESNIDLVPERNIASPRNDESLKVSVIRYQNSRSRSPRLELKELTISILVIG